MMLSGPVVFVSGKSSIMEDPDAFPYFFDYDPTDHIEDLSRALEY